MSLAHEIWDSLSPESISAILDVVNNPTLKLIPVPVDAKVTRGKEYVLVDGIYRDCWIRWLERLDVDVSYQEVE